MKPIETQYQNYKFRSRLEARWAVFFDKVDINWTYEPQGFNLPSGPYLPDFHLLDENWDCFVEIKPDTNIGGFRREPSPDTDKAAQLCHELSVGTNRPVLLISGYPGVKNYKPTYEIYIFVPSFLLEYFDSNSSPNGIGIVFRALGRHFRSRVTEEFYCTSAGLYGFICRQYRDHPEWFSEPLPQRGDAQGLIEADKIYFQNVHGKEHQSWRYGLYDGNYRFYWGARLLIGQVSYFFEECPVFDAPRS